MSDTNIITVVINGYTENVPDFETAARRWAGLTYRDGTAVGGIALKVYRGGVCIRDAWLLHKQASGVVYVNPRLAIV